MSRVAADARRFLNALTRRSNGIPSLLVLTHDHPDPDAMASAWALVHLVHERFGLPARIVYGGVIGRMENQMMARILKIPMHRCGPQDLKSRRCVALVDTQPPFANNPLPSKRTAALIVDHHPRHAKTKADIAWIDEKVGATATLLFEALRAAHASIPKNLATALFYGIGSETQHLGRQATDRDIAAYRRLMVLVDMRALSKIQNPSHPSSFFRTLARAVHEAFIIRNVIGVHLGEVATQDIVAHMADFLLTHEKMRWSVVTGRYQGRLYISVRTLDQKAEAGRLLWRLLGGGSRAGGHSMIAGGSIEVGQDAAPEAWRQAEGQLISRFLKRHGIREPFALNYPYREPAQKARPHT
ncbi:MAG: DHH family phosphoesterase [Elusimicrobia bacterium]|nr:DHH family phosphoesterase [Elusimicrobiota bacterium]